jgi:preprotein translocase subunit SecY
LIESIKNIFKIPELKKRIFFTLGLLVVYRIGGHIPTPGINGEELSKFLHQNAGALMGFFDMFSGGSLSRVTIFALGIMPYISASIILQLLTVVFPTLAQLQKEGERGRRKITQYTRYGTIGISLVQALMIAIGLEGMAGGAFIHNPGWAFRVMTMITLTCGTAFIMWLGEQITERGIGNGISLIIFGGIVARFPAAIVSTYRLFRSDELSLFTILVMVIIIVAVIAGIVFMERGQRRIPVQYAKKVVGGSLMGGQQSTHIPLKLNTAGVIPPIFASSILMFPATLASFSQATWVTWLQDNFSRGGAIYTVTYVSMIVFFAFFYTAVVFNPVDVADNMKKYGGFIPGIRPGTNTSDYIYKVLNRITFGGAIYLSAVCVLPDIFYRAFHISFYFGGTSLLIVVGVALDTVSQIETHLITRHYDGFMKGVKIKGRRG